MLFFRVAIPGALFLAVLNCGSDNAPRVTPDPWSGDLRLARFEDLHPDPSIIEVNLEARVAEWEYAPGRKVRAMTYNGSVPGPLLEGRVGDTVIVHFTNRLDQPTTIHWHGVRVPNDMDGAEAVQTPVMPGQTFTYRFQLRDVGTYWYHPHVNEPVQMENGLYGPIVVRGEREPRVDREGVLMLDDVRLGNDGQIAPPGGLSEQHAGREGDVRVINGRQGVVLPMRAGMRQRWRVINAASARYFRLGMPGHKFVLIGTDVGFLESAREVEDVLLAPGDRADLIVTATGAPGTSVMLQTLPYDRGHGAGTVTPEDLARVEYTMDPPLPVRDFDAPFAPIERMATDGISPRTVTFGERTDPMAERATFLINGRSYPDVPPIETRVGNTEVWDLVNDTGMDHPFHLHGYFFQVLARNGTPEPVVSWEDTINLRAHERVRIAFRPEGRPGMWMYHCHILEHVANGMMGHLHVTE